MYQQPLTQTLSAKEFFQNLNCSAEDETKLTARDVLMTTAEVAGALASCWALHIALI